MSLFSFIICNFAEDLRGVLVTEFGGGKALLHEVGKKNWEAALASLSEKLGGTEEKPTNVKLSHLRRAVVEEGQGVKKRGLVEWSSAFEAALSVSGVLILCQGMTQR